MEGEQQGRRLLLVVVGKGRNSCLRLLGARTASTKELSNRINPDYLLWILIVM